MKNLSLTINFTAFQKESDLDVNDLLLLAEAGKAMQNAYAPYSKFFVGAAALLDNGEVIAGNNQENAAYPSGLCAERVTLFYANSRFPEAKVKTIAIVAQDKDKMFQEIISPCGACRQVMSEKEKTQQEPIRVILAASNGSGYIFDNIESLLPLSFSLTIK